MTVIHFLLCPRTGFLTFLWYELAWILIHHLIESLLIITRELTYVTHICCHNTLKGGKIDGFIAALWRFILMLSYNCFCCCCCCCSLGMQFFCSCLMCLKFICCFSPESCVLNFLKKYLCSPYLLSKKKPLSEPLWKRKKI